MRLSLLLLLILPALASSARASCIGPVATLSWTYPAQDATGIPTNAQLFLPSAVRVVSEDGIAARAVTTPGYGNARFDPGPLAPDTDYTFRVTVRGTAPTSLEDVEREESLRFRTGPGPDLSVASPVIIEASEARVVGHDWPLPTDACAQITQGCFDTFEDTQISFELALSPPPVAWIISQDEQTAVGGPDGYAYRGACGAPWLLVHRIDPPTCVRIHNIAANGTVSSSERHCAESPADGSPTPPNSTPHVWPDAGTSASTDAGSNVHPSPAASDNDGCSVGAGPASSRSFAGLGTLALGLLTALGARRRGRREGIAL